MKKLLLIFIIGIMLISLASAWTSDRFIPNNEKRLELDTTTLYGKYEVVKYEWWDVLKIWTEEVVKVIELKENTDKCGANCYAIKDIDNRVEGALIEDVRFYREVDGKMILWNAYTNWHLEVENKNRYVEQDIYDTICYDSKTLDKNGTALRVCEQVYNRTETIDTGEWLPLRVGEKRPVGKFKVRLMGSKKAEVIYDWQVKVDGVWLEDWALWGVPDVNLTTGFVAQYKFNTNQPNFATFNQGNVSDTFNISNGTLAGKTFNDGTPSGGVNITDGAMTFDGVDDYVEFSADNYLNTSATFSFWLKSEFNINGAGILDKYLTTGNQRGFRVFVNSETKSVSLQYSTNGEAGTVVTLESNSSYLNTVGYNFYTIAFNSSNTYFYRNGVLITTQAGVNSIFSSTPNLIIGKRQKDNLKFNGSIDDVQIYNRALATDEITAQYNLGRGKYANTGNGLVAQYSGRDFAGTEASPTTIYDTNHLVNGKINEGIGFDGVNDYVDTGITSNSAFNGTAFTLSAWINPISRGSGASNNYGRILDKSSGTTNQDGFSWYMDDGGKGTRFRIDGGNTPLTANVFGNDEWSHVSVVVKDVGGTAFVDFYVNGIAVKVNQTTGKALSDIDCANALLIGNKGVLRSFNGSIDDVRIYNRSLSADEISALYNAGEGTEKMNTAWVELNAPADGSTQYDNPVLFNTSIDTIGTYVVNVSLYDNKGGWSSKYFFNWSSLATDRISYWRFEETSGTLMEDSTGKRNGTIVGATVNKIGIINKAYSFDGANDNVETTTAFTEISGTGKRTISAWTNGTGCLWGYGASSSNQLYNLCLDDSGRIFLYKFISDWDTGINVGTGWQHIVITYNGTHSRLFVNGIYKAQDTSTVSTGNSIFRVGSNFQETGWANGTIDEVGVWSRALNDTEIFDLYRYSIDYREDTTFYFNQSYDSRETITWNIYACDSDGDCGFAPANRTVTMDSSAPTIEVLYPNGTIPYGYAGQNISLNYSIVDTNVQSCWYDYNGTNLTIPCTTNSTFILSSKKNFNMYANDSLGNLRTYAHSWNYSIFKNNMTFNPTTYQTKNESFTINITENPSLTNAFLVYDSVNYQTSQAGQIWTSYVPITSSASGNKSFYWSFNNSGTFINTETNYQNIEPLVFSLCNSTNNIPYLNITFKDEDDDSDIYASISTSTFLYYLDVSSYNKTYIFQNNTANPSYSFCGSPAHLNISVDYTLSYRNITAYPLRTYNQDLISLSNQTTNTSLYLLSDTDGLYTTFQVLSTSGNPLNGVEVTGTRQSGATTLTVATGTTDSAGAVTFFLNPDYLHTFTFEKTGYNSYTTTVTPSSTTYTVTLSSTAIEGQIADYSRGITQVITPSTQSLNNHTYYVFNYSLTSTYWTISEFGFTLRYSNGTTIGTINQITSGGSVVMNVTTANSTRIIMDYYYLANSTYVNGTRYWLVSRTSDFSIMHFFSDLNLYLSANLYGINGEDGDDTFGMSLIAVLILVLTAGMLTYRYGIQSEASILAIITGIVMFLNFVGFIPNPDFLPSRVNLGEVLVFISAVITIGFIIKEESR